MAEPLAVTALKERVALARKLHNQAADGGDRPLAEHWAMWAQEFQAAMEVLRNSVRRVDRLAAESERSKAAAE